MSTNEKKRYKSGAQKRRKKKEAKVKLEKEMKLTPSLFQLDFTRSPAEHQASGCTAGGVGDAIATDLPSELTAVQMAESQAAIDDTAKTDKDFNVIDPERQIQASEFQNDL